MFGNPILAFGSKEDNLFEGNLPFRKSKNQFL